MAKTSIANSESGSSVRTKLNASEIRPEATLIDIDSAGDKTIDCGLGMRLYDTITANRTIGTINNLTLPTVLDIDGAFTVDFSAALKADGDNEFYGNNVLVAGVNYITLVPKQAGGIIFTYVSNLAEAFTKAGSAAITATIDWEDGTFQPKTLSTTINITTISNQALGGIVITITGGTDVTIATGLIAATDQKGKFDPTNNVNILRITCYDSATPKYFSQWEANPLIPYPIVLSDETTDLTAGLKRTFRLPAAYEVAYVTGDLVTAATGTTLLEFDIKEDDVSIFTTRPTIDASALTTDGATIPSVIGAGGTLTAFAKMTAHIHAIGNTTPGKGAKMVMMLRPL